MNCVISGIVGIGLVGASIATSLTSKQSADKLKNILPKETAVAYQKIASERANLYIQGLLLGLVLSYFILTSNLGSVRTNNRFHTITLFFAITLIVTIIYYVLMPKSDKMSNYLKTPQEINAWNEVYTNMKTRYSLGFILGALAAIPLGNSLCY